MHAAVLSFPNGGLRCVPSGFPAAAAKSAVYGKEIADGALHFPFHRGLLQQSFLGIRSEGNRKDQSGRNISSNRTDKEAGKLKDLPSSDNETSSPSNQDEIIALFRRIQSSISKRGSAVSRRSPSNPKEKQSTDSVREALQKYPRKRQARAPSLEENEEPPRSTDTVDDKVPRYAKVPRPVSEFMKKSPIPVKEDIQKVADEQLPKTVADEGLELQKMNEMKLTELKDLAKRKGVKGYSKLKKGELLELLKGLLQSSS